MTPMSVESERRGDAPHPGPLIKAEYIDALGIATEDLAAHIDMPVARLDAMLAGARSIDVDAAVRLARALQLPAERIMRMQVRYDFAVMRAADSRETVGVYAPRDTIAFPERSLSGKLARSVDLAGERSLFFQQRVDGVAGDASTGMHALWRGDRLRVYESNGTPIWHGLVLTDLDGRVLLPFVRTDVWLQWFAQGRPADLWIGPKHASFFERMHANAE